MAGLDRFHCAHKSLLHTSTNKSGSIIHLAILFRLPSQPSISCASLLIPRECEEVEAWINEKEVVAANEELGKDLEHVEILQKRFADFVHDVLASEDRVLEVNKMADSLLEAKHSGMNIVIHV